MAKLILKFEQSVLKEVPLSQGVVTIGRLPDNVVHIDNLAVSGHHAKIYWEHDKYVIEDNNSLNGTYVNKHRVSKAALKEGDEILVGKHTLSFKDEWHEGAPAGGGVEHKGPAVPQMQATMVLDTKKAKEMLAMAAAARTGGTPVTPAPQTAPAPAHVEPPAPPKERIGTFAVLDGKTDAKHYVIGKMCVIGKSDMASIKLKGFFAPTMAALINKREGKYFISASEPKIKVRINGQDIAGQKEMNEGDIVEVAGVKLTFSYQE